MEYRSGSQIREDFLRFFEEKGHRRVHSSSLVPVNDPTLLFTNAGMNQFKDVFLGAEVRPYTRAVTAQKCVRAGGKHNDLENVGFTRRHHTFFEMLGNFSFGDYFKPDAIAYAWELLTSPKWFGIDPTRLYVTIFEGDANVPRDQEAYDLWLGVGVPPERIFELGAKDNFWQMGETGPCGPCSEIYFDLGVAASETGADLPFGQDDQRYMEIWNLVFMQFDRSADGVLTPLPEPSIDTGMGLERIACVLQSVLSNYDTDLFTPLTARAAELTQSPGPSEDPDQGPTARHIPAWAEGPGASPDQTQRAEGPTHSTDEKASASLRIIADHARAATFLISDGVQPANEGRGYVLRKILRRGIRHGRLLGQDKPFMFEMVYAVRDEMRVAYPELLEVSRRVSRSVLSEEEQFVRVIERGSRELDLCFHAIGELPILYQEYERERLLTPGELSASIKVLHGRVVATLARIHLGLREGEELPVAFNTFPGNAAFFLYETFGLPLDFMTDSARDAGIEFDLVGFEAEKAVTQQMARASWKGGSQKSAAPVYRELPKTEFEGYSALRLDGARVLALVKEGTGVPALAPGEEGEVVLDATSFYAESGGQVGDIGLLYAADHQSVAGEVRGCTKPVQGVFAHRVHAKQTIAVGDTLDTAVDGETRRATTRNHTATHLLQAALREVLGPQVKQAGSLNNASRLRFDFSHFAAVAEPELAEVESLVNRQVLANTAVETLADVPIDSAVNDLGATALFGEKYGDRVRVVRIGDFSIELCGGTHTAATGEIGVIKLTGESSVASGVRRVEALTGTGALAEFRRDFDLARVVSAAVAAPEGARPADTLRDRLQSSDDEIRRLKRELDTLRLKAASAGMADAAAEAVEVGGVKLLTRRVDGVDKAQMRELVDQLRTKLGSGVVVLGAVSESKVILIVGVTKDLTGRIQAGKLVGVLAPLVGGRGGGRPDLAEAGGTEAAALDGALAKTADLVHELLA